MTELDRIIDARRKRIGLAPNTGDKGFFRSVKDNFLTSSVSALGGMGKTGEEVFGVGSGLREWSEDTLRTNRQWQPSSDDGIGAYVGGAIGSAAGSTAVIAPALAADALFGTKGALSFGLVFSQTYGENLQRNRAAYGPDAEEKSRGLAAAESAVDAFTEVALGTIPMVGKALKGLSYGGKRQLVQAMFREAERDLGRSGAKRFFLGMAKNGAEEAGEEGIQYVNSWLWRAVGGDKRNEFHTEEMADAMAQGFIGGAALASPFALHDARMRQSPQENRADVNDTGARLTAEVARDLGLNVRFFDEEGAPSATDGKGHRVNGWHDPETNEIWIDRTSPGANPLETLGHEFKHYLDQRGLTEQFDKLFREGMNEAGKQVLSETEAEQAEAGYAGRGENEFSADTFGSMWTKPEFWQDVTGRANKMDAGFTQELLDALQDFIRMIQRKLKGIGTPEAKELFDNMKELKAEAARLTAEARAEATGVSAAVPPRQVSRSEDRSKVSARGASASVASLERAERPGGAVEPQSGVGEQSAESSLEGTATPETGSVGSAALSDGVQRIAVKDLHIDPARFQFKSKADKITGVDESNKVGGEFDPKTAGNLYVWEDKAGKKFVVNGHHRLELARRDKVDAVNAIVEREADGISAEQARRNGVLINIRDEQGDVRDYAEFVRSEKMDDATAEKEGILAREKGRRGYLIGRYASENLYHRFRDGDLSEVRAATIADVARGDEAIEAAGIKAKAMPRLQLQEYLKFLKETPREKSETGDLFGFDDSAMREGEALSKIASQHIRDLQERLRSVKGALASPERAAKGDVKVGKRAKKIFKKTEEELRRWENWPTDAELRQEMLSRAEAERVSAAEPPRQVSRSEDRSKVSARGASASVASLERAERPGDAVEPQGAEDAGEQEANVQAKQKLVQGTLNWENGKRYSLNTVNVPETPKDMPAPEDPKALRNWLKDFYKGKAKPVNSDTNWSISVPATGLKETLNHLYRKRGSYRRDLHFRSLTAIDSMLEQAKFDRFEDVQNEKKGDKISIFNVLVDFGEDGIYNARMVVKHFGEDKNYYDHRLTKFEEVPIPRLLPEGSGRHSTSSDNTISSETEKSSGVEKKSDESDKADGKSYSLRRQVNPILEDGEIRREYQDLLNDRDYTPERIAEWDKTAIEWIERQGGIQNAAELIANSTEHNDRHVATLVRRHVMNSEVFRELSPEVREEVEYQNLKEGTSWGREGAARRLAAMTLDSIERVRALFRRLHENMPDAEAQKLRNRVMDSTGVDVYNLPEDIVNDKAKLDEVLRAELASKSKWHDKAYEYWINAILSGPATHSVNVMGNTANGLYELGVKRFTEAALNSAFQRKDGATFGEFKEMWKAFDVKRAWGKALEAFNLETLTPAGKFRENQAVAIPGEVGRVVRLPGRLLTMADAFARELLIPVEASAQAYRAGKAQGLKGDALRKYIEAEIANPGSKAYQAGKASAERVIFQEEPGALVRQLVAMREGDGIGAQILKFTLPFIKTPANVLKQAVRKSPLGSVSLGIETGKLLLGKRKFDGDYVGRVAEQLLAWGAFLALGGLGDDDEPRITGSSAAYGSAEQKYKANRIPPYSIRIGDTWYSYQRLDPFATGLALIADASQALRDVRNGAEATGALKKMIQGTGKMLSEKSYLDSINQIYQFMENPEKSAMDFGTNFLSSWVPNVMRQASYAVDDYQRDYKSAGEGLEFLRDQMHVVTSKAGITRRVPKVDLWGREITKEEAEKVGNAADTVWRFLIPVKRVGAETDNPGERLIENWNARHPDEAWWGSLPNRKVTVNGERVELSGEEYHDYAVKAGRMAYKQMMNAVRRGLLHPDDPTEADIKLLKQIFRRARRTVKVSP